MLSKGGKILQEVEDFLGKGRGGAGVDGNIDFNPDTPLELALDIESTHTTEKNYKRSSRSNESEIEPMSGVVYCLRFLCRMRFVGNSWVWLLVLGCVDKETQTYERVGVQWVSLMEENRQFLLEMEPQVLNIV